MMCSNCSRIIPDDSKNCPYCNCAVDVSNQRCPSCWAKLDRDEIICKKCGCDTKKYLLELEERENQKKETFFDKIKKLPLWIKIAVPLLIICLALGIYLYDVSEEKERISRAVSMSENYIVSVDIAVGGITDLAQVYKDMVYGQSWLDHTGSAKAVRDVYKNEISTAEKAREPITYAKEQIAKQDIDEITKMADEVYKNYTRCYGYVIGEIGSYRNYMENYKKILDDYNKSVESFRKIIEEYK